MSDTGEFLLDVQGSVGCLTLNRPTVHNAISRRMWEAMPEALDTLRQRGAKVVVISGQGNSFAAGADFKELAQIKDYSQARENWYAIANCLKAVAQFSLPTIASIVGNCMGGGLLLALACDLRYAAEDASFALPVAKLGIVLDDGNIERLVSLVGVACAKEIIFSARVVNAERAKQIGLINDYLDSSNLEAHVKMLASDVAKNAAVSIEQAKLSCARISKKQNTQDESCVISSYLSDEFRSRLESLG
ncbi:MAG: enoyl-CoA hydratase/isomerase family protein [Candidatus Obscuribacterales bacterium]|nr:enoyl-CoA hydratase/isomerase family protein [Candidatus Obscuribacterales bacterium]